MSSKSSTVILPIVLCLCAWWIEGRWQWRNPIRLAPVFLMAFIAGVLSIWTVRQDATLHYPQMVRSWPERMIAAGDAVWFYMGKLLWPHPLITIYPRWEIDAGQWSSYLSLLAATGVVVILWIKSKSWSRPCFFALAYFLVALLPVLGLVDHSILRYSLVFDHFQYLASMAPLALAGAGMVWVANVVIPGRRWLLSVLSGGVLLILAILSWRQTWIYKNPETLWTYTLAWNPTCLVASDMLSVLSAQNGHIDEAIAQLQRVVEMDPNYAEAHYNLGIDFSRKGQIDDAVAQFQQALDLNPNYAEAHYNLGVIHDEKGRVDDAIAEFQAALESKPSYAEANNNLGIALGEKGHFEAAIAQFEKALEANPKYAEAHNNLGNIFFQDRRLNEAINQYQKALEVDPTYAEAHNNLGLALFQKRRVDEAVTEFQEAVRLKPDFTAAQNNLTKAQAIAKEIENRKR
jgi:tetratricopeptide (TPR) repeat protein